MVRVSGKSEEATFLGLKIEEGAESQGMQVLLEVGKGKKRVHS